MTDVPLKVAKICNLNFWIGNDPPPPPPYGTFSKIHPLWKGKASLTQDPSTSSQTVHCINWLNTRDVCHGWTYTRPTGQKLESDTFFSTSTSNKQARCQKICFCFCPEHHLESLCSINIEISFHLSSRNTFPFSVTPTPGCFWTETCEVRAE